jgi:hypothetical protein
VRTALLCPGCGKRCGSAERLADDHDVIHITFYNVKRPGTLPEVPVHVTRGRTLRLSEADGWPFTWRCEECRTAIVELDRDAARQVGSVRQFVVSMPIDN